MPGALAVGFRTRPEKNHSRFLCQPVTFDRCNMPIAAFCRGGNQSVLGVPRSPLLGIGSASAQATEAPTQPKLNRYCIATFGKSSIRQAYPKLKNL